jgi:hypothetical protein
MIKAKLVLETENSNSQIIPKSRREPVKIAPTRVAEVKHRTEEKRIAL